MAAQVTAPPASSPSPRRKAGSSPPQAVVSWRPAASANGPLAYKVVLDGHALRAAPGALSMRISPRLLGDGTHKVQVLATDSDGQATLTSPVSIKIDGRPPQVSFTRVGGGSAVSVLVRDPYSGVDSSAVSVSFGDGSSAHGRKRFHHRYAACGRLLKSSPTCATSSASGPPSVSW